MGTKEEVEQGEENLENADDRTYLEKYIDNVHADVVPERDLLAQYLQELGHYKILTHEQVVELCKTMHEDPNGRENYFDIKSRNTLVIHNLRLAVAVARRYRGRGLDYLDLIQEANIGLMEGANRFEYRKGFRFSTYAMWWVRQTVTRAIADYGDLVRMPVHMHEKSSKINGASKFLINELGREPTAEEIAIKAEMDVGEVKKLLRRMRFSTVYLEDLVNAEREKGGDNIDIYRIIADETYPSPEDIILAEEKVRKINEKLEFLKTALFFACEDRERAIFRMRYGFNGTKEMMTLEEIAELLSITKERIRQILNKIWTKLDKFGIKEDTRLLFDRIFRRKQDLTLISANEVDAVEDQEAREMIQSSIPELLSLFTEQEQNIFRMHYGLDGTYENKFVSEIAKKYNAPKSQISLVIKKVWGTLREKGIQEETVWRFIQDFKASSETVKEGIVRKCPRCGGILSSYNVTGQCFRHSEEEPAVEIVSTSKSLAPMPILPESGDEGITASKVIDAVCKAREISLREILGSSREAPLALARHIAMFLLREDVGLSFPQIAQCIERADHTTVIYGWRKISQALKNDRELVEEIGKIRKMYSDQGEEIETALLVVNSPIPLLQEGAATIIECVADFYEIRVEDLFSTGKRRPHSVARARYIVWYLLRKDLGYGVGEITGIFKANPSNTSQAISEIDQQLEDNIEIKKEIAAICVQYQANEEVVKERLERQKPKKPKSKKDRQEALGATLKEEAALLDQKLRELPLGHFGDPQRTRAIFRMRYALDSGLIPRPLRTIGEVFSISRERISQIISKVWIELLGAGIKPDIVARFAELAGEK